MAFQRQSSLIAQFLCQEEWIMNPLHYVAAIFGIAFGVVLTLQINRLLRGPTSGELPGQNNDLTHFGSYGNTSDGKSSYTAWIGKKFPSTTTSNAPSVIELQKEKASLQARLQAIDSQLQQIARAPVQKQIASKDPTSGIEKNKSGKEHSSKPTSKPITVVPQKPACEYDFKVYVYEIPPALDSIRIGQEARRNKSLHVCHKCILEQFSLEYIVNDYFTQFCGRTYNPDEADFFYLPLVRDAEFRMAMSISTRNRAPSSSEWALLNLLEKNDSTLWRDVFNITDRYWHAHHGADHIIAMPAPVTNIRHETSQRGFFHYMMHLHPPIFLCLEYSLGFVQEYPQCATGKNIVVPYPTTDPELFSGKLTSAKIERKYLLYYAGGLHGDCVEVRKAMKVLMQNSTRLPNVIPPVRSNQAEREHGFLAATFCPIPIGDSPSSKRMYDVLNFGCIPVVLSDDLIWAFSDQSGGPLNHSTYSLQIPQSVVHYTAQKSLRRFSSNKLAMGVLPNSGLLLYDILQDAFAKTGEYQQGTYVNPLVLILQNIPAADVLFLQKGVQHAAPYFRYYKMHEGMQKIPLETHAFPDGGAMQVVAQQLAARKRRGLDVVAAQCAQERGRKHKYISNFACDGRDKVESLVRRRKLFAFGE